MIIQPFENTRLYGLDNYFIEVIKLFDNDKMPNKILFSGKKGIGKATLAYHIINYIFTIDEDYKYDLKKYIINSENKSFKLLKNNSNPNFYLIDLIEEKKNIDIDQIRKMITYTNKSSFNEKPRFILIDNIEYLNKNSVNALLKVIEEPNKNIFFILIHNNEKNLLSTLKSRCLTFKINLPFRKTLEISNFLLNANVLELINNDLIHYYNTPGEFIRLINFAKEKQIDLKNCTLREILNLLIDNSYYKKNRYVKNLLINFIELYLFKEYKFSTTKISLLRIYHNLLDKIHNTEKFNLDDESLFLEFKSKLLNG